MVSHLFNIKFALLSNNIYLLSIRFLDLYIYISFKITNETKLPVTDLTQRQCSTSILSASLPATSSL